MPMEVERDVTPDLLTEPREQMGECIVGESTCPGSNVAVGSQVGIDGSVPNSSQLVAEFTPASVAIPAVPVPGESAPTPLTHHM